MTEMKAEVAEIVQAEDSGLAGKTDQAEDSGLEEEIVQAEEDSGLAGKTVQAEDSGLEVDLGLAGETDQAEDSGITISITVHVKCIKPHVMSVNRNVRFLLSQHRVNRFIAESALINIKIVK